MGDMSDAGDIGDADAVVMRVTWETPGHYNYKYISLGQTHPALLLMRQQFQSFNHLLKVDPKFGKNMKFRNHSNENNLKVARMG